HVFVGGTFTTIGGLALPRLAKLSASTGAPDPAWAPAPDDNVFCLATNSGTLYVGGSFSRIGERDHARLARLNIANGTVDDSWNPEVEGDHVFSILPSGDSVFVGGLFTNIGGLRREGVAKIFASGTGAVDPG